MPVRAEMGVRPVEIRRHHIREDSGVSHNPHVRSFQVHHVLGALQFLSDLPFRHDEIRTVRSIAVVFDPKGFEVEGVFRLVQAGMV